MLSRLKIAVYNIKVRSPAILKAPSDHNLHILIRFIGLDHTWLLFLCRRAKASLVSFTLPLFYRALITLQDCASFLSRLVSIRQGLSKSFISILLSKE